jgi:Phosphopantetheine attachment site
MVPAAYVRLDALPLTPNGKLDRKALPLAPSVPATGIAGRLPRSPDEALLCRLFARMTGHAAVDANSDFFAIGGDSLAAMILVTELRQLGRGSPRRSDYKPRGSVIRSQGAEKICRRHLPL